MIVRRNKGPAKVKTAHLQSFFFFRWALFLFTFVLGSFFTLLFSSLLQISSTERQIVDKISAAITSHQNKILNEIALEDWGTLRDHLDHLRQDLTVDSIVLQSQGHRF